MKRFATLLFLAIISSFSAIGQSQDSVTVTFKVDFNQYIGSQYDTVPFSPGEDPVYISGDPIGGWDKPGTNPEALCTDANQDKLYTWTTKLKADSTYQFKFFFVPDTLSNSWSFGEYKQEINRYLHLGSRDTTIYKPFGHFPARFKLTHAQRDTALENITLELDEQTAQSNANGQVTFYVLHHSSHDFVTKSNNFNDTGGSFSMELSPVNKNIALSAFQKNIITHRQDSMALVELYNATGGDDWKNSSNWMNGPVYAWYGVQVDSTNYDTARVTDINLEGNNLRGSLPSEIGNLSKLRQLKLKENQIGGSIPDTLGNLEKLTWLGLSFNQFEGSIPPEIGNMKNLIYLWLHENQLAGSIPPELGNLSNLERIQLGGNQLTGTLPPELGNLSQMTSFTAWNNQLEGAVPEELANLSNLYTLNLNGNQIDSLPDLSGLPNLSKIRMDYNHLSFKDLQNSNLDWSQLQYQYAPQRRLPQPDSSTVNSKMVLEVTAEGSNLQYKWFRNDSLLQSGQEDSIVVSSAEPANYYCHITQSDYPNLTLQTNAIFTGTLVNGVAKKDYQALVALYDSTNGDKWSNNTNWKTQAPVSEWYGIRSVEKHRVTRIDLQANNLVGPLPERFYDLTQLKTIWIADNKVEGKLSKKIGHLEKLVLLGFPGNQLIGKIPEEIYNLSELNQISLERNQFEGKISPKIGKLDNLRYINLGGNKISGEIPREIGNLKNLESLYLANNELSGNIPSTVKHLQNLKDFVLWGNALTDTIPAGIGNLEYLEHLNIGANKLSGEIPSELGNLNHLKHFILAINQLEGSIPKTLGDLDHLNTLSLKDNQLSDTLPSKLGQLQNLTTLNLSRNKLSGNLPDEYSKLQNLKKFFISDNNIKGGIPASFNQLTNCKDFILNKNNIDTLPNLTNLPLERFWVVGNALTFKDLKSSGIKPTDISSFEYGNQKNIPVNIEETDDSLRLSTTEDAAGSSYQWHKNFTPVEGKDSTIIYPATDTSTYYCKITHREYPNLELQTRPIGKNIKQGVIEKDYQALKSIYKKTDGKNWVNNDNWLSSKDVNNWVGVEANGARVRKLNFSHNNLTGPLPEATFELDSLEWLAYWDNNLEGTIPDRFDELPRLKLLSLADNQLEGKIPATLDSIEVLQRLYLDRNQLSEASNLGDLSNLVTLMVNYNQLTFDELKTLSFNPDSLSNYYYSPQDSFRLNQDTLLVNQGDTLRTDLHALTQNNLNATGYLWKKEGQVIDSTAKMSIPNFSTDDTGAYTGIAFHSSYPNLTLTSEPLEVNINSAPFNLALSDTTLAENSPADTLVGLLNSEDENANDPHQYQLIQGDGTNDADNDKFTIREDSLFANHTFNYENHNTCHIYIEATDQGGASSAKAFQIAIEDRNDAPAFTSQPPTHAKEDSSYTYMVSTRDPDADSLFFQTGGLPDWLSMEVTANGSATLSGTPKDEDVGSHVINLKITDNIIEQPVEQDFTIEVENVNNPPQYTSDPINQAKESSSKDGYGYQYRIKAVDSDQDHLNYSPVDMPDWLSLQDNGDGTADLTGNPQSSDLGDHQVTIGVSDGVVKEPVDQSFVITVLPADVNALPEFTHLPNTMVREDSSYIYLMEGYDIEQDSIQFEAKSLPEWLKFTVIDSSKAILKGKPKNKDVGTHPVEITATDRYNDSVARRDFTLRVQNTNDAPAFISEPVIRAEEDSLYQYAIETKDVDDQQLSLTTGTKPGWLNLEYPNDQPLLTGKPDNEQVGTHRVSLKLTDHHIEQPIKQTFDLTVQNTNDAPVITSEPNREAFEDSLYSYTVTAKDADRDGLTFSGKSLPSWLSLEARDSVSAVLKGKPEAKEIGDHQVKIEVGDGHLDQPVQQSFTLNVMNTNDKPEFISLPKKQAKVNQSYTYELEAIDRDGDSIYYDYTSLPDWLSLTDNQDSTALLSGTPPSSGEVLVGITITDSIVSQPVKQLFTLKVLSGEQNSTPAFTSAPVRQATEDKKYEYNVEAYDADGDPLTFTAQSMPKWLSLNDQDKGKALLSGTPKNTHVGMHQVSLSVQDTNQASTSQSFSLEVSNTNDRPTLVETCTNEATEDESYASRFKARDKDGDAISFNGVEIPEWLNLTAHDSTLELTGTPKNAHTGKNPIHITMSDAYMTEPIAIRDTIEVANVNDKPQFTSQPVTSTKEDSAYKYTIKATDPDGDPLSFGVVEKPAWLTLNDNGDGTASLSGTPTNDHVGTQQVAISLDDGNIENPVEQAFSLEVINTNDKPRFTSQPVTSAKEDSAYVYHVTAFDMDGDSLAFGAEQKPSWLTLEAKGDSSASLHGTPNADQTGDHKVILTVTDSIMDAPNKQEFTITVEEATTLSNPGLKEQIEVYPNPTSGKITLEGAQEGARIILTRISGKTIKQQKIRQVPLRIDLSDEAKGIYLLRYIEGKRSATFRIIVN